MNNAIKIIIVALIIIVYNVAVTAISFQPSFAFITELSLVNGLYCNPVILMCNLHYKLLK